MKKDNSYFESIEQAELIKETAAIHAQIQKEIEVKLAKLNLDIEKLKELGEKEKEKIRSKLRIPDLYKKLDNIPEYIRKKTG